MGSTAQGSVGTTAHNVGRSTTPSLSASAAGSKKQYATLKRVQEQLQNDDTRTQITTTATRKTERPGKMLSAREALRLMAEDRGRTTYFENEQQDAAFLAQMALKDGGQAATGANRDVYEEVLALMHERKPRRVRVSEPMPIEQRIKLSGLANANQFNIAKERQAKGWWPKGSLESINAFGETVAKANEQQYANRMAVGGYMGRGRYDEAMGGVGGFWDSLLSGIKTVGGVLLDPLVGVGAQALNSIAPGVGTALQPVALSLGRKLLGTGAYNDNGEELLVSIAPDGSPEAITTAEAAARNVGVVKAHTMHSGGDYGSHVDWGSDNPAQTMNPLTDMRAPVPKYDRTVEVVNAGRLRFSKNIIDSDKIQFNNIVNHGQHNSRVPPRIRSVNDETADLIFSHNEYLRDVTSTSLDFHNGAVIEINPGLQKSFPLLSRFASKYSEYDFVQCIFHFKSLMTEGNDKATGSVMLVPSYNPADPPLTDKRGVENSEGAVSDKVTCDLVCGIECDDKKVAFGGLKYTREVDIDPIGRRQYDIGSLQVAMQGVPVGTVIGELWCSYQVRLSKLRPSQQSPLEVQDGCSISTNGLRYFSQGTDAITDTTKPKRINVFEPPSEDPHSDPVLVRCNLAPDFVIKYLSTEADIAKIAVGERQRPNAGFVDFDMAIVGGSEFQIIFELPWQWDPNVSASNIITDGAHAHVLTAQKMMRGGANHDHPIMNVILENVRCTVPYRITDTRRDVFVSTWPVPGENTLAFSARVTVTMVLDSPGTQGTMSGRIGLNLLDGSVRPVDGVLYEPVLFREIGCRISSNFTFTRTK